MKSFNKNCNVESMVSKVFMTRKEVQFDVSFGKKVNDQSFDLLVNERLARDELCPLVNFISTKA